ncbi:MAG: glutamine--fructose-6-phosphate transaminase (isomerizing) [Clostridia bacterium]|nr:glutamine--fructose-6-phosphate transaminase (isomerizing) [Clostridia bacterium]
MCGIFGYTGAQNAVREVIAGLRALEYRGSDSAGVARISPEGALIVQKCAGRLDALEQALAAGGDVSSRCALGHTRWATHGAPTDANAHPHGTPRVQIVHNGIIENSAALRRRCLADGYVFASETDTEAAAFVIDRYYRILGDPILALRHAAAELRGSYAFGVLFADFPDRLFALRHESPLLIGRRREGNCVASDLAALGEGERRYHPLEQGEIACVTPDDVLFYPPDDGAPYHKDVLVAAETAAPIDKGGYPHHMRKEIADEPQALRDTLFPRIRDGLPDFSADGLDLDRLLASPRVWFVACGTACHAARLGASSFARLAGIDARAEVASEFRSACPMPDARDTVIAVSQSGETADTLAALRAARESGARTVAVVNTKGSAIARAADCAVCTEAGVEVAVPGTKTFVAQVALLRLLACALGRRAGRIGDDEAARLCRELSELPDRLTRLFDREEEIVALSRRFHRTCSGFTFFIGRGEDSIIAAESALKLKEIAYVPSESYPAGELKHGSIALIERGTPVVAVCSVPSQREKMLSSLREVASRGASVLTFAACDPDGALRAASEAVFCAADDPAPLTDPLLVAAALQLFAYHVARQKECEIDRPRNLAKSVTVE